MKAMIYTKTGGLDVLQVKDIPKPKPKNGQILICVKASSLNIIDYERFKTLTDKVPLFPRLVNIIQGSKGKPLGGEVAGIVVEAGNNVQHLKIGDEVYGRTLGIFPNGGWAEYAVLDETQAYLKPAALTFEEAAVMPISGETALGAVRKANIKPGQEVMIYGASGGVGQYAVQFTKAAGANVTGVCSTRNIEMAYSIGCKNVVDYKKEDFTKIGKTFDAIIGINGCNPIEKYKKLLKPNGIFICVGNGQQAVKAIVSSLFSKKVTTYAAPMSPVKDYLPYMKDLADKEMLRPYIDKTYSIQQIKDAVRYIVTEHVQGKVALRIDFN